MLAPVSAASSRPLLDGHRGEPGRLAGMLSGLDRALAVLAIGGIALGIAVAALVASSPRSSGGAVWAALIVVIAWSFIGVGLFAWRRRPGNRVGPLMAAVGPAWLLSALASTDEPGLFVVGVMFGSVYVVIIVQVLLSYPSGRAESRLDRGIIGTAWLLGAVTPAIGTLFYDYRGSDQCPDCPSNPLLIAAHNGVVETLYTVVEIAGAGLLLFTGALLLRRWARSTGSRRRELAPTLWAGTISFVLFAVLLSLGAFTASDGTKVEPITGALCVAFLTVPYAFLLGLTRSRVYRAGVVDDLLRRLGRAPGPDELRDTLAGAVGDQTLALAYWLPDAGRFVDASGQSVEVPEPGEERAWRAVERDGRRIGALVFSARLREDPELLDAVANAAALALENQRLDAALRARVEELRASRARLIEAADEERRRLERDLHDGAQQRLVAHALNLRLARSAIDRDPRAAAELLDAAQDELRLALEELRELARGIHPAVLAERGLDAALGLVASRAPVPVDVRVDGVDGLPRHVEVAAYFVAVEALTNIAKYAQASRAHVLVGRADGHVAIEVSDDGIGGADPERGSGLRGLADRVAGLDGRLEVSSPSGGGTTVRAEIPVPA